MSEIPDSLPPDVERAAVSWCARCHRRIDAESLPAKALIFRHGEPVTVGLCAACGRYYEENPSAAAKELS